ncbi:MAG: diacylglycerol kinase family protein [Candidatus Wallbacteria bacterium]|nr:diacylglycerol kinase family protein [Candidatus Wallbacteria bacterium]
MTHPNEHLIFFYNPCSGTIRKAWPGLTSVLSRFHPDSPLLATDPDPLSMKRMYGHLANQGVIPIALGGDGTLSLLINAFYPAVRTFGLVPVGTANVIAGELGIPSDPVAAVSSLAGASRRTIDLGRCDNTYFALCLGIGLDGYCIHSVSATVKKLAGKAAYGLSFASGLIAYREPVLEITVNGLTLRGYSLIVQNFRNYAGRFRFSSEVSSGDGCLHMVLFKKRSWGLSRLSFARQALGIFCRDIEIMPFDCLTVRSSGRMMTQIDGDASCIEPHVIETIPGAVEIIVP